MYALMQPIVLLWGSGVVAWVLVSVAPVNVYTPYADAVFQLVVEMVALSAVGFIIGLVMRPVLFDRFQVYSLDQATPRLKYLEFIFIVWLVISIVEVIEAKGVPIQSIMGLPGPAITTFGIPLVHGFAQSLFFFLVLGFGTLRIFEEKHFASKYLVILAIWALMLFNRGSLVIGIAILLFLYMEHRTREGHAIRWRKVIYGVAVLISIFITIGTLRSANTSMPSALAFDTDYAWGFLWIYSYLVSSYSNLAYSMDIGSLSLINTTFNAATGFAPMLSLFGPKGVYGAFALVGVLAAIFHGSRLPMVFVPIKVVMSVTIGFMFFGVFLFNLAFIMLMLMAILFAGTYIVPQRNTANRLM